MSEQVSSIFINCLLFVRYGVYNESKLFHNLIIINPIIDHIDNSNPLF